MARIASTRTAATTTRFLLPTDTQYSLLNNGTNGNYATGSVTGVAAATAAKTVSCWVKWNIKLNSKTIWSFDSNASPQYSLNVSAGGTLQIGKWTGGTLVSFPTFPLLNRWVHIVWTYNGTTHTAYLNGISVNTSTTASDAGTPTTLTLFDYSGHNQAFNGLLKDFRTYNRELSASEVSDLYYGREPSTSSLVIRYKMNEGSGTTLTNSATGGNGTITNSTYSSDVPFQKRTAVTSRTGSSGYTLNKTITIDKTKVGSTDRTNYAMLFTGTYTYLKTQANGGSVTSSSGYDIVFFSDSGLTNKLNFERVYWNGTTGECEFYVNVPTVSASVNTVIYMGVGNAAVTSDQQAVTSTYAAAYKGVWHMEGNSNDSTSGSFNGTDTSITYNTTNGKIIQGAGLGGASRIAIGTNTAFNFSDNFAIATWVKSTVNGTFQGIIGRALETPYEGYAVAKESDNKFKFIIFDGAINSAVSDAAYTDSNYHRIVAVRDAGTSKIYIDGALQSVTTAATPTTDVANSLIFGRYYTSTDNYYLTGALDEVFILNTNVSADWVTTDYNNQNSPSTFYTIT